jgi:hypothetical protein
MPKQSAEIALTQLAPWYDPTRIQTWPSFLASLPPDAVGRTPTDLGRQYVTERMTSKRHASAFNLVRNLPGLEQRGGKLQLRGVGLLERGEAGYRISARGTQLAAAYQLGSEKKDWVVALADVLLGREPRTRAFVRLLSWPGAVLVFERDGWFLGSYRLARVERTGQPDCFPLDGADDRPTLRQVMDEESWWCLGDWRGDALLEGASDCRYCGTRSDAYSLHDIGLALRATCEVLLVAGLLRERDGTAWLDLQTALALLPKRATDFGWTLAPADEDDLLTVLADLLPALRSPTGHIVASELRKALEGRGVAEPDRAIAEAMRQGRVLIYEEDYGQSRHGSGLFGDPRKQLVKLRLVGEGAQA